MILNRQYKKRVAVLFLVTGFIYCVILVRAFCLQVVNHAWYAAQAQAQYQTTVTLKPFRARIYDRSDVPLAMNKETVSAFVLPHRICQREKLDSFLAEHFPLAHARLARADKNMKFFYIKRKLSDAEVQLIQQSGLSDIHLLNEPGRFYPYCCAGALVGMTDIDNQGLLGIEKQYDALLSGKPQVVVLQKDARSGRYYFQHETKQEGLVGTDIQLTIDADLQFLVAEELQATYESLSAKEVSALIVDPASGDVLALASVPAFDPNNAHDLEIENTKMRPISDAYELGSVFKVFTALAALQEGVVSPDELINCRGVESTIVDGRPINTVPGSVRGVIPFREVIAVSNNIGIAIVAKRVGKKLYDHYKRLGFGSLTGVSLMGEHAGFVNQPLKWSKQSIISLSYGYEVTATLTQLARAFAIIARDGKDVHLHMVKKIDNDAFDQLYDPGIIQEIKNILELTTTTGTTRRARIDGYKIMSKTGTANLLKNGVYDTRANIFTCAGIVQKGDYQRVIVVFVKEAYARDEMEHTRALYASTVAAPLFERIAQKMIIHDKVIA